MLRRALCSVVLPSTHLTGRFNNRCDENDEPPPLIATSCVVRSQHASSREHTQTITAATAQTMQCTTIPTHASSSVSFTLPASFSPCL